MYSHIMNPMQNEYFLARTKALQARAEIALNHWLPAADRPPVLLHQAMRYAVLGGGKRIRPVLLYATGDALSIPLAQLDGPAATVEIIHSYSLVHDDLPAMDDDDLRRGQPTCHKAFDEATAILAGDALQALAFSIPAIDPAMPADPAIRVAMIALLAEASGSNGMAGGQAIDLAAVGHTLDLAQLETMHLYKTGALIRASVGLAALCRPDLPENTRRCLDDYARFIGLAFQVRDDILDIEGDTAVIGKPQGSDVARNKPTYPAILGMDGAKQAAQALHEQALAALADFDAKADMLRWLSHYIVHRST
ncbi:MAG: (2E,6E)-farnesyl diphosphate synthase [Gammaproteobacteria bacterium]|nr:(2E,6E)-farnesyl diphosphate synthase [Gammaproteobacteria bacterium]